MKIKKGYTESQFIDTFNIDNVLLWDDYFNQIYSYNNYLKQPLLKEMFVNEVEHPKHSKKCDLFHDHLTIINERCDCSLEDCKKFDLWREAEKKVIFKDDWNNKKHYNNSIYFEDYVIDFSEGTVELTKWNGNHLFNTFEIKTLSDLFRTTDGELDVLINI
jgi:hypothetical protein